jgi:hypothetical protein
MSGRERVLPRFSNHVRAVFHDLPEADFKVESSYPRGVCP